MGLFDEKYGVADLFELLEKCSYTHIKTMEFEGQLERMYQIYTKDQHYAKRAVIVSPKPVILIKDYMHATEEQENKLLENIVKKYHQLETNIAFAPDNTFHRTLGCAAGIAIGIILPFPLLDDIILGVAGYYIGKSIDEKEPVCKRSEGQKLEHFLQIEGIAYDQDAYKLLKNEAAKTNWLDNLNKKDAVNNKNHCKKYCSKKEKIGSENKLKKDI